MWRIMLKVFDLIKILIRFLRALLTYVTLRDHMGLFKPNSS